MRNLPEDDEVSLVRQLANLFHLFLSRYAESGLVSNFGIWTSVSPGLTMKPNSSNLSKVTLENLDDLLISWLLNP